MKKRALTLLEIMIVIFLITLITGVIGYNMKGSLDKGKAFRTEQAREQLRDLLLICLSEKGDADAIASNPLKYLKDLELAKDPKNLIVDGWKENFEIKANRYKSNFRITSKNLDSYNRRHNKVVSEPQEDEEE